MLLGMSSCSSKLGELTADNFYVSPNPLEAQGGNVTAVIDGKFPEKYMKKKAVVEITPTLRANDGSKTLTGSSVTFQGESVLGNNQTISYANGGTYTMRSNFEYDDAIRNSSLYLTFNAKIGNKDVSESVPDVKIADGVVATGELYRKLLSDGACYAPDSFQRVQEQKFEAQIKFLINQAQLRKSELGSVSVTEFVEMLRQINRDRETLALKNIDVLAYASPEGGFDYNDRLAGKRQDVTEKYVRQQLDKADMDAEISGKYTAEDWEGFRQLVEASNIQDKDVILRVLSMYKDPEERERQIRNMSEGFQELADGILPELRRSRLIINYEVVGRSDEQIKQQLKEDASQLSADELLYAATLEDDLANKQAIYTKAAEIYPTDSRIENNIAAVEIANGNYSAAQKYVNNVINAGDNSCTEAYVNKGIIALADGDIETAETNISRCDGENANAAKGLLSIANGKYAAARSQLEGKNLNSTALAQLLNGDYSSAQRTLGSVENKNAMTDYLAAVVSARQGNNSEASRCLRSAIGQDGTLSAYAADDIDLKDVSK